MLYEDYEGSRREFLRLLAEQGEEPAFILRSRRLEAALLRLDQTCQTHRQELLQGPRLHLRQLAIELQSSWRSLGADLVDPSRWVIFEQLFQQCNDVPLPVWATPSVSLRSRASRLKELYRSVDRFNNAWGRWIDQYDLASVNSEIQGYNAYYTLEKACALGREDLAARGFSPKPLITRQELHRRYPAVQLPTLR